MKGCTQTPFASNTLCIIHFIHLLHIAQTRLHTDTSWCHCVSRPHRGGLPTTFQMSLSMTFCEIDCSSLQPYLHIQVSHGTRSPFLNVGFSSTAELVNLEDQVAVLWPKTVQFSLLLGLRHCPQPVQLRSPLSFYRDMDSLTLCPVLSHRRQSVSTRCPFTEVASVVRRHREYRCALL